MITAKGKQSPDILVPGGLGFRDANSQAQSPREKVDQREEVARERKSGSRKRDLKGGERGNEKKREQASIA